VSSYGVTGGLPSNDPAGGVQVPVYGYPDLGDLSAPSRPKATGYGFWGGYTGTPTLTGTGGPGSGGYGGGTGGPSWLSPQDGSVHLTHPIDVHQCMDGG
jgi:hypothetical protein